MLLGLLASLAGSTTARADLWQGAGVLKPRSLAGGVYGQVYVSPTGEFQGFANLEYGLVPRLQAELRIGAGTRPFYLGTFAKFLLAGGDIVTVSWWGGMFLQKTFNLEHAILLSRVQGLWEFYFAPVMTINFGSGSTFGYRSVPGVSMFIDKKTKVFVEGAISASQSYSAISFGLRRFL